MLCNSASTSFWKGSSRNQTRGTRHGFVSLWSSQNSIVWKVLSQEPILPSRIPSVVVLLGTSQEVPPSLGKNKKDISKTQKSKTPKHRDFEKYVAKKWKTKHQQELSHLVVEPKSRIVCSQSSRLLHLITITGPKNQARLGELSQNALAQA